MRTHNPSDEYFTKLGYRDNEEAIERDLITNQKIVNSVLPEIFKDNSNNLSKPSAFAVSLVAFILASIISFMSFSIFLNENSVWTFSTNPVAVSFLFLTGLIFAGIAFVTFICTLALGFEFKLHDDVQRRKQMV